MNYKNLRSHCTTKISIGFNINNASDLSEYLILCFACPHVPNRVPTSEKVMEVFSTKIPSKSDILNFATQVKKEIYRFLLPDVLFFRGAGES